MLFRAYPAAYENLKEDVSRPVRDRRFHELMKMISRAARKKRARQKSISPDNSRLTARTFLKSRLKVLSATPRRWGKRRKSKESTLREGIAEKPALEIIVVITRSCGTPGFRPQVQRERAGERRRVLFEDTISSRNVPGFY